ncbi:hypothetical protein CSQ80_05950 [Cyanobacterium aponinum IPPAS B-1201]|nr:hypothetical protein CSQ80_05950 [Cyanobacterium aponinum IPPAS B-1201]
MRVSLSTYQCLFSDLCNFSKNFFTNLILLRFFLEMFMFKDFFSDFPVMRGEGDKVSGSRFQVLEESNE